MSNIKKRISSFVAAFAMLGTVTVPSIAEYVSNDTVAVAADAFGLKEGEYLRVESANFYVYGVFNGIIERCHVIKIYADSKWETRYYLEEKRKWFTQKDGKLFSDFNKVDMQGFIKKGTKVYQSYSTNSKVIDNKTYSNGALGWLVFQKMAKDQNGKVWYYMTNYNLSHQSGWICSDNVLITGIEKRF